MPSTVAISLNPYTIQGQDADSSEDQFIGYVDGVEREPDSIVTISDNQVQLQWNDPLIIDGETVSLTIIPDGQSDEYLPDQEISLTMSGGNPISQTYTNINFFLPVTEPPSVVISEFFNHKVNNSDQFYKYIELYNKTDEDILLCDQTNQLNYWIEFTSPEGTNLVPFECLYTVPTGGTDHKSHYIPARGYYLLLLYNNNYTAACKYENDYSSDGKDRCVKTQKYHSDGAGGNLGTKRLYFSMDYYGMPMMNYGSDTESHVHESEEWNAEDSDWLDSHMKGIEHGRCVAGTCDVGKWAGTSCTDHTDCGVYAAYVNVDQDYVPDQSIDFNVKIYNGHPLNSSGQGENFPGNAVIGEDGVTFNFSDNATGGDSSKAESLEFWAYDDEDHELDPFWPKLSNSFYYKNSGNTSDSDIINSGAGSGNPDSYVVVNELVFPFPPIKCSESPLYYYWIYWYCEEGDAADDICSDVDYWDPLGLSDWEDAESSTICSHAVVEPSNNWDLYTFGSDLGKWIVPSGVVYRHTNSGAGAWPNVKNFGNPLRQNYWSCDGLCENYNPYCTDDEYCWEVPILDCTGTPNGECSFDLIHNGNNCAGFCDICDDDDNDKCIILIPDQCGDCSNPKCYGDDYWLDHYYKEINSDCTGGSGPQDWYTTAVDDCITNLGGYTVGSTLDLGLQGTQTNGTCDTGTCSSESTRWDDNSGVVVSANGWTCTQDSDCGEFNWFINGSYDWNSSCSGCMDPLALNYDDGWATDCRRADPGSGSGDTSCCLYDVKLYLVENNYIPDDNSGTCTPDCGKVDLYIFNNAPISELGTIEFDGFTIIGTENNPLNFNITVDSGLNTLTFSNNGIGQISPNNPGGLLLTILYYPSETTPNSIANVYDGGGVYDFNVFYDGGDPATVSVGDDIFVNCSGEIKNGPYSDNDQSTIGCDGICATTLCDDTDDDVTCNTLDLCNVCLGQADGTRCDTPPDPSLYSDDNLTYWSLQDAAYQNNFNNNSCYYWNGGCYDCAGAKCPDGAGDDDFACADDGNFDGDDTGPNNFYDDCGHCVNTGTDVDGNKDCAGTCYGSEYLDCEGTCSNLSTLVTDPDLNELGYDCNNGYTTDCDGNAVIDCDGNCCDGNTGVSCYELNCFGVCADVLSNDGCGSNGTCSDIPYIPGTSVCVCDSGWAGSTCATECQGGAATPCNGNGDCADGSSYDGTCTCYCPGSLAGGSGTDCWTGGACDGYSCGGVSAGSCQNGGSCVGPNNCSCSGGWTGEDCTTPTCTSPMTGGCGSYGECTGINTCTCHDINGDTSGTAVWNDGGTAETPCDTPICSPACQNSGVCTWGGTGVANYCNCDDTTDGAITPGYEGSQCQTPICDPVCDNGTCTTGTPNTCSCTDGWGGDACADPICSSSCQNGGSCTAPDTCTCTGNFDGATCHLTICNGTTSSDAAGNNTYCQNGLCDPELEGDGECTCSNGWSGDACDTPTCDTYGCVNGDCTGVDTCDCDPGWSGDACDVPICSSPCQNSGTCSAPDTCTCTADWTGATCTTPVCDNPSCQNGGTCSAPDTCNCSGLAYWAGNNCNYPVCGGVTSSDEAGANTYCGSNGVCGSGDGNCDCNDGWSGSTCLSPTCTTSCENGGVCSAPDTCNCSSTTDGTITPGYEGDYCQTPICSPICDNGGTCTTGTPNTCSCTDGWTGDTCTTPVCDPSCGSHGTCTAPDTCDCESGWSGDDCNTPTCVQTCENGGSCSATTPNECDCVDGWDGYDCTSNTDGVCVGITCTNGTCPSAPNVCSCDTCWTGDACDTIDGGNCCTVSCVNGSCTSNPATCDCESGWSGDACDVPICSFDCNNGTCTAPNVCTCEDGWADEIIEQTFSSPTGVDIGMGGTFLEDAAYGCYENVSGYVDDCPIQASNFCAYVGYTQYGYPFNLVSYTDIAYANDYVWRCNCTPGYTGLEDPDTFMCDPVGGDTLTCDGGDYFGTYNWTSYTERRFSEIICGNVPATECSVVSGCTVDCFNGGSCSSSPTDCNCAPGWGNSSAIGNPPCDVAYCTTACGSNGTCTSPDTCTCHDIDGGISGEPVWTTTTTPCDTPLCGGATSCANGGTCSSPNTCTDCDDGYSGNDCLSIYCLITCTEGSCPSDPNTCVCTDDSQWTGTNCNEAVCGGVTSGSCQNSSICTAPDTCICVDGSGWSGDDCNTSSCATDPATSCVNGTCPTAPDTCECESGWSGDACDVAVCTTACGSYGTCTAPNTCECDAGYIDGSLPCDTPVCDSPACANNGTCTAPNTCDCSTSPDGWGGDDCNTSSCAAATVCNNGGTCPSNPSTCECADGWGSAPCNTAECPDGCVNGSCTAPGDCTCSANWSGDDCTTPECPSGCTYGDCTGADTCTCDSGWQGTACDSAICSPACENGGSCDSPNTCSCINGWGGSICTEVDSCNVDCTNGECTPDPNTCVCDGYWGDSYGVGNPPCDVGYCISTCVNGDCVSDPNTCACNTGWEGAACDTPICNSDCVNGTCTAPDTCTCSSGNWGGDLCDLTVCGTITSDDTDGTNSYCQNDGICDGDGDGDGTCDCDSDWEGDECITPICSAVTCDNDAGGYCSAPDTCTCYDTFCGSECEACPSCENGGTCDSSDCSCDCGSTGYTGDLCQYSDATTCNGGGTVDFDGNCTCNGTGQPGESCDTYCDGTVDCNSDCNGGATDDCQGSGVACCGGSSGVTCHELDDDGAICCDPGTMDCGQHCPLNADYYPTVNDDLNYNSSGTYGGTPPLGYDCTGGTCNGSATKDCAGVCEGSNELCSNDGLCTFDCGGACDCYGNCNGSGVTDCAGACDGTAVVDCNGCCSGNLLDGGGTGSVCDYLGDNTGLGNNCSDGSGIGCDCADVCGGSSAVGCDGVCSNPPADYDVCGVCGGSNTVCATVGMGEFSLVGDGTFYNYQSNILLSNVNDVGDIDIPFKTGGDHIGTIQSVALSSATTGAGYSLYGFDAGIDNAFSLIDGDFTAQSEFELLTFTISISDNDKNKIVQFNLPNDPSGDDGIDVDIMNSVGTEYNDNLVSVSPSGHKIVFGCTDPFANKVPLPTVTDDTSGNCNTEDCGCFMTGFNNNNCTTLSCNPVSHSTECTDLGTLGIGENCCCTYPTVSLDKLVFDGTDYLISDHGSWGSTEFNVLDGSSLENFNILKIHWTHSGFTEYSTNPSDVPSTYVAREVIFPNYNCIDPTTGNLETTVGHTTEYSCTSDNNCNGNGVYCEWTNIRSYGILDVTSWSNIQPIDTTDWLQNTSDMISGDYTFRLYWPVKDIAGNPVSYDSAIIQNEITFKLKREACVDSTADIACDSGYNQYSEIDCSGHYIDTVSCSTTCSGGYMDTEACSGIDDCLDYSCCTYQDLFGTCCADPGSCDNCTAPNTTHRWYPDVDLDGIGCSSGAVDLCPETDYPYGNPWIQIGGSYWLYDGETAVADDSGDVDFWVQGNNSNYEYNITPGNTLAYLKGVETSDAACSCVTYFHCCNDSVSYTSFSESSLVESDCDGTTYHTTNCDNMCATGYVCREINYIQDLCSVCMPDYDGDNSIPSSEDTSNGCNQCNSYYPHYVTLDDTSVYTYSYNDFYDCNTDCHGTAFADDCGECVGGNTSYTWNDSSDSLFIDDCGNCHTSLGSGINYVCSNETPIVTVYNNSDCDSNCGGYCERMSSNYNDYPNGTSGSAGRPHWNNTCISCDGVANSDAILDSCNICCGTASAVSLECNVGTCDDDGEPCFQYPSDSCSTGICVVTGPDVGDCGGTCFVENIYDDLNNCCLASSLNLAFPDLDISEGPTGETGYCDGYTDEYSTKSGYCVENNNFDVNQCGIAGYTWVDGCEDGGHTWMYTNPISVCDSQGNGPFNYDGGSIHNCTTNPTTGGYPTVSVDGCVAWTSQPYNSGFFDYYVTTDDCFGYIDNCGICWSFDQYEDSGCPGGDDCVINSGMDCRGTEASCYDDITPYYYDDCCSDLDCCLNPECQDGEIIEGHRWYNLGSSSQTKTVCPAGQIPTNSDWNLSCTGCLDPDGDLGTYSSDYTIWCDDNTHNNQQFCSSYNFLGCCCHFPLGPMLSSQDLTDNSGNTIGYCADGTFGSAGHCTSYGNASDCGGDGDCIWVGANAITQGGILVEPLTLQWTWDAPPTTFHQYYSFQVWRNNSVDQCENDFIHIATVDGDNGICSNDGVTPCTYDDTCMGGTCEGSSNNYTFIDNFEPSDGLSVPTSDTWISYYIKVIEQSVPNESNYLGWEDGFVGGDCTTFHRDVAAYVMSIQPSVTILDPVDDTSFNSNENIVIKVDYSDIPYKLYDSDYNTLRVSLWGAHYVCSDGVGGNSGTSYNDDNCNGECGGLYPTCVFEPIGSKGIDLLEDFPVDEGWSIPFDGSGNNGDGFYCPVYGLNNVQWDNSSDCDSSCLVSCESEHYMLFDITTLIWNNAIESGYYYVRVEYVPGSDVYLDTDVSSRFHRIYINVIEGCTDAGSCTCETCPGLCVGDDGCDDCDIGVIPDYCMDLGYGYSFYNPSASVDVCVENTNVKCTMSYAGCTCSGYCIYPDGGCLDSGHENGGHCDAPDFSGIDCTDDSDCEDGSLCGCDDQCHVECFLSGANDICTPYGGSGECIAGPTTYVSNQYNVDGDQIYGSVIPGSVAENYDNSKTYDNGTCYYLGCTDEPADNWLGNYYQDPNTYWADCPGLTCCMYAFQYRLKYEITINNEIVRLSDGNFAGYIEAGVCNDGGCASDGSDTPLNIQLPIPTDIPIGAPTDTVPDYPMQLILTVEGYNPGQDPFNYVWYPEISEPGGSIYEFIYASDNDDWVIPDNFNVNSWVGQCVDGGNVGNSCNKLPSYTCSSSGGEYNSDDCNGECSGGGDGCIVLNPSDWCNTCSSICDCSGNIYVLDIPTYDYTSTDPIISNQVDVTLTNPVFESMVVSKTLHINLIRNNYGISMIMPLDRNVTMNFEDFIPNSDGILHGTYEYTVNPYDLDGDSYELYAEVISGGDNLIVTPNVISSDDITSNIATFDIISLESTGYYVVRITMRQLSNESIYVNRYACAIGGSISPGGLDACVGDIGGDGDAVCEQIEMGSICELVSVPIYDESTIVEDFVVDVIDTRGPDGNIIVKPLTSTGISNNVYNFKPYGIDIRDTIGGEIITSSSPIDFVLPSISYFYGDPIPKYVCGDTGIPELDDDGFNISCNPNIAPAESGCADDCIVNQLWNESNKCGPIDRLKTIYYGDPAVGGVSSSDYTTLYSTLNSIDDVSKFMSFYSDNIDYLYTTTGPNENDWVEVEGDLLGTGTYPDNSTYDCVLFSEHDYTQLFETITSASDIVDNPNKNGWLPFNAFHENNNPYGNTNDTVFRYVLDIQKDGLSLSGFPIIYQDWNNLNTLMNCDPDETCYQPPPNIYSNISNIENILNNGFTYTFNESGVYEIIVEAYDLYYNPAEEEGTNAGQTSVTVEIDYIIPLEQSVGGNYLPWQGINVPNYYTSSIEYTKSDMDYYDIDKRKSLGSFVYINDNDPNLTWEEISENRYEDGLAVSVEPYSDVVDGTDYSTWINLCESQYESEKMKEQSIRFKNATIYADGIGINFMVDDELNVTWNEWGMLHNNYTPDYYVLGSIIDDFTCDADGYGCQLYDSTIEMEVYITDVEYVPTRIEWTDGENNLYGFGFDIPQPENGWTEGWNYLSFDVVESYFSEPDRPTNWHNMEMLQIYRSGCRGYYIQDFNPDVDVRTPLGLLGNLSTPFKYYDSTLNIGEYVETSAPTEVQFYFYKRYVSELFKPADIIDFTIAEDTYVGFINWGDGSDLEYEDKPFKLGNGRDRILTHSYVRGGIYNISGYMFTARLLDPLISNEVEGIQHFKKFTLTINLNQDDDEIYIPYESINNYKKSTPIIGGISENSVYFKSIKRQLGYLYDSNPIDLQFNQYRDRLSTEYSLLQISENYIGEDVTYYTGSIYSGSVDDSGSLQLDGNEVLIYSGSFGNVDELGSHIGDVDVGNIKYISHGNSSMWEQLGFTESDAGNPLSPRYWKNIVPKNYEISPNYIDGVNILDDELEVEENQSWVGGFYYPVLPNINKKGEFTDDIGSKIPFGSPDREWNEDDDISPITNESFYNQYIEVNFTFESESDGIIEDSSGFNNIGIFIGDYRVKFDNSTRQPIDVDTVSTPELNNEDGAF